MVSKPGPKVQPFIVLLVEKLADPPGTVAVPLVLMIWPA